MADQRFILITGANSGLGFSICCRLADEFLASPRASHQSLFIIFTTRSARKGVDTRNRLQEYVRRESPHASSPSVERVTFIPEDVDLCNLVSVRTLSWRLCDKFPKLDAVILNAGLGGWTGIDWPKAVFTVLTDLVHAVSWPTYKIAPAGVLTEKQVPDMKGEEETRLGAIFCANVFGHYMLTHNVIRLLRQAGSSSGDETGRIIWVSSLEASINYFNTDDLQGLRTTSAYESSKALTDILALTSTLPSTVPWVKEFHTVRDANNIPTINNGPEPSMHVSHPGICGTAILPLPLPLFYCMIAAFWLARLLGSPWHTLSTYLGAIAPAWLAGAPQSELEAAEAPYRAHDGGRAKWGSSCDLSGNGFLASTEVDGWGYGGVVGSAVVEADRARRRKRNVRDLTKEEKERFEETGRAAWRQMEELRVKWERVLDQAGV